MNEHEFPPTANAAVAVGPAGSGRGVPDMTPVEEAFDERVSIRTLIMLYVRAFIVGAIVFFLFFVIWALTGMGSNTEQTAFGTVSTGPSLGVLRTGFEVALLVFWVVGVLTRVSDPISEWKTLVEDKADAAQGAYAAIAWALRSRRTPVSAAARRVRSDILPGTVNNRLVITDGNYTAYISVFEYGTSLYIGWTMWRRRMGVVLIWTFQKDLIADIFNRSDLLRQMLRTEKPRAMREALHLAAREGMQAAMEGTELTIASVFGGHLPIENLDLEPSPVAVPRPPSEPGPARTVMSTADPALDGRQTRQQL